MRLLVALTLITICGCSKGYEEQPRIRVGAASASATVSAVPRSSSENVAAQYAAPNGEPSHYRKSFALFKNNVLSECIDFDILRNPDAGAVDEASLFGKETFVVLSATCWKTFADRTALASCTEKEDGNVTQETFYDFEKAFATDEQFLICTKEKGKWQAIDRKSREFALAKMHYDADKSLKMAEDLQRGTQP